MSDPADQLAPLGDTISVALEKIFGKPMGLILIVLPAEGGQIDATTNMDPENYLSVLRSVSEQHGEGKYKMVEAEVTKQ